MRAEFGLQALLNEQRYEEICALAGHGDDISSSSGAYALGVAHLMLRRPERALPFLSAAAKDTNYGYWANYWLAHARHATNDLVGAFSAFDAAYVAHPTPDGRTLAIDTGLALLSSGDAPRAHREAVRVRMRELCADAPSDASVDNMATLASAAPHDDHEEVLTCRAIAERALFIVGYGRSSTTICANILNSLNDTYLLTEANFFLCGDDPEFRKKYNARHERYENQVSKGSYAPDLGRPGAAHWWNWLAGAADVHAMVGDKIAFSSDVFEMMPREATRAFFERRFFRSRYIFLIRDPIPTLLSVLKLVGAQPDDSRVRTDLDAWLQSIQLWADAVRTFPRTLTLTTDTFDRAMIDQIGAFIERPLDSAYVLLNDGLRRSHAAAVLPPLLGEFAADLRHLYKTIQAAIAQPRPLWQAAQKRTPAWAGDVFEDAPALIQPLALGECWLQASSLRQKIAKP